MVVKDLDVTLSEVKEHTYICIILFLRITDEWKTLEKEETRQFFVNQIHLAFLSGVFLASTEHFFLLKVSYVSFTMCAAQVVFLFSTNDLISYTIHWIVHRSEQAYNDSGHEALHLGSNTFS